MSNVDDLEARIDQGKKAYYEAQAAVVKAQDTYDTVMGKRGDADNPNEDDATYRLDSDREEADRALGEAKDFLINTVSALQVLKREVEQEIAHIIGRSYDSFLVESGRVFLEREGLKTGLDGIQEREITLNEEANKARNYIKLLEECVPEI